MPPTYDGDQPGPGKSAQIDAIAHAEAAKLKSIGQEPAAISPNQDPNHDRNEIPEGNPGRMGSGS